MIDVISPGLQTTVQDIGRIGYYEVGMPPSGAMDNYSYRISNLLVGNNENAATLEITYIGPVLEFETDTVIALTGGEIPPKINDKQIPMWKAVDVKAGDRLSFDFIKRGARVYLAVAGGIEVPLVMNSRSTYTLCGIGGFKDRALKENDQLKIGNENVREVKADTYVDKKFIPKFKDLHEIRMIMGLCSYRLAEESKEKFFSVNWTVTPEADRVGYRLKGERLNFVERKQPFGAGSDPANVVDQGYPIGSIQLPDGVEPIALLNDAVTGGGYVTIGTIISSDLNKMAQIKTGEKIKFISVNLEESLQAREETRANLNKIREQLI